MLFPHFCHVSRTLVGGRWPGRWSVVDFPFGRWSAVNFGLVGGFYGRCWRCRWSVSNVIGGRCFAFLLVGGLFLFLRMVSGRCLNQYMVGGRWLMVGGRWLMVGGRWSVVCGRWLVGGRWFCTTLL